MNEVIPPAFSFRFAFPAPRIDAIPRRGKALLRLPDESRLHWPGSELTGWPSPIEVKAAWNPNGLGISVRVTGKKHPPVSNPDAPDATDGVQVWIDTRNTQTIHRANRFCHHFCLLPNGGGDDGLDPLVRQLPLGRAVEDAPVSSPDEFRIHSSLNSTGYEIDVWLAAEQLNGFDNETSPRLGFYCALFDSELGNEFLTVDSAFPVASDPSLWHTLDLVDETTG